MCGVSIDPDAMRLAPFGIHDSRISPPVSCDVCLDAMLAVVDDLD